MSFKSKASEEDTTAYDVVNKWQEENLADVIYGYGEEKYARRIARAIVQAREEREIKTSSELAKIIKKRCPYFIASAVFTQPLGPSRQYGSPLTMNCELWEKVCKKVLKF